MAFHSIKSLVLGAAILLASGPGAFAQAADENASQTATRVTGWGVQCASQNRAAPLACKAEQQMLLAETNQLFIKVTININGETKKPSMIMQLPHGLHLPSGIKIQFDDKKAETQHVETCDGTACYVYVEDAARIVVSMKGANEMKLSFKNMAHADIETSLPLKGFSDAYKAVE
jgi:invasion protein IalB